MFIDDTIKEVLAKSYLCNELTKYAQEYKNIDSIVELSLLEKE